jgi:hypothetical protein
MLVGILEMEVTTHWHEHVVRQVVLVPINHQVVEGLCTAGSIVGFQQLVGNEWVVSLSGVPVEAIGREVEQVKDVRENLSFFTKSFPHGSPYEFHAHVRLTQILILVVKSREEEGVKAHLGKETCVGAGVTEGINLPSNSGSDTKLLHDELVTDLHVVDHVFIVGASFVVHGPASVEQLQTTLSDKLADVGFHLFSLVSPPDGKELHFNVGESLLRVLDQAFHSLVNNVLNTITDNIVVSTRVVLVNGLQPADIVVSVMGQMDGQLLISPHNFSVEGPVLGVHGSVIHVSVCFNARQERRSSSIC